MTSCSNTCGSKQAQADTEGGYQRYGVRSYLHQFYEDCTASIWENEDDFQIQRSPNRWSSVFWKVRKGTLRGKKYHMWKILGLQRTERLSVWASILVTLNTLFFSWKRDYTFWTRKKTLLIQHNYLASWLNRRGFKGQQLVVLLVINWPLHSLAVKSLMYRTRCSFSLPTVWTGIGNSLNVKFPL